MPAAVSAARPGVRVRIEREVHAKTAPALTKVLVEHTQPRT